MILIGRSGDKILKNYWLNDQTDKLDYTRSVDVDQLSECRRSICCAVWVLHDSDFAERTARARFVETLFVCGTQNWKRTAAGSFRACSQNTDNTVACFTRCKVYVGSGDYAGGHVWKGWMRNRLIASLRVCRSIPLPRHCRSQCFFCELHANLFYGKNQKGS